jgi:hypothetical protein
MFTIRDITYILNEMCYTFSYGLSLILSLFKITIKSLDHVLMTYHRSNSNFEK